MKKLFSADDRCQSIRVSKCQNKSLHPDTLTRDTLIQRSGFTIVELIVVMAVILIIAGMLAATAQGAKRQAKISQARAMMASIETALGMFQADTGGYPSSGTDNSNLVTALTTKNGTYLVGTTTLNVSANANWSGPYITFKEGDVVGGVLNDPWAKPYIYANPGTNHAGGPDYRTYVDIYSQGPDGSGDGTGCDDVGNWKR